MKQKVAVQPSKWQGDQQAWEHNRQHPLEKHIEWSETVCYQGVHSKLRIRRHFEFMMTVMVPMVKPGCMQRAVSHVETEVSS